MQFVKYSSLGICGHSFNILNPLSKGFFIILVLHYLGMSERGYRAKGQAVI